MRAMEMVHDVDPKEAIFREVAHFTDKIKVLGPDILVAVYVRPEKTKSGLLLPDKSRDEDKYQGKIGLVVKMGPIAFKEDVDHKFPVVPQIGDWVVFRVGDTFEMIVGERHFRFVQDVNVRAIVERPDITL